MKRAYGIIALILLMSGCSLYQVFERADPEASPTPDAIKKVATDWRLARRIHIDSAYLIEDEGLTRHLQVNLSNRTRSTQDFMYKFEWFDLQGMQVYDPAGGAWNFKSIHSGERMQLQGVGPTPAAVDWRMTMKRREP